MCLIPILTHLFACLPSPAKNNMKQLNDVLHEFVLDGKTRIKPTVFRKEYTEGRLKMIDIYSNERSMKIKWLKKLK